MRKSAFAAAALVCALALAGCSREAHDSDEAAADTGAIAEQLRRDEAQWVADWASLDADRVMAHYSGDATLMVTGAPRMTGGQIRSAVTELVQDPNFQLRFAPDQVAVASSGDLAYTRGTYSLRTTNAPTRQPQTETGNYIAIYRRQQDGSWKAVEDIVSAGAPAPAPSPPG